MTILHCALVDDAAIFDPIVHAVEDLDVFSASISQRESEFAQATLEVRNPRVGLLSLPNRRLFLSRDGVLLLDGRISGTPRGLVSDTLAIEVVASPADSEARLEALRLSLLAEPGYLPEAIPDDRRGDIGEVLTGVGRVLAWSRTTGNVSAVDPLGGSTVVALLPFAEPGIDMQSGEPTPSAVDVVLEAEWIQELRTVRRIDARFETLTPDVADGLPETGAGAGGGWSVLSSGAYVAPARDAFGRALGLTRIRQPDQAELDPVVAAEDYRESTEIHGVDYRALLRGTHELRRREEIRVRVEANIQPWHTAPDEELRVPLIGLDTLRPATPSGSDSVEVPTATGSRIVRATASTIGWTTLVDDENFVRFLDYAAARAAARLRYAARSITLSFECPLSEALAIDHDTLAAVSSPDLPGGTAAGRVIEYELVFGSNEGARVVIACAIGTGFGADAPAIVVSSSISQAYALEAPTVEVRSTIAEQRTAFDSGGEPGSTEVTISYPAQLPAEYSDGKIMASSLAPVLIPRQIDLESIA